MMKQSGVSCMHTMALVSPYISSAMYQPSNTAQPLSSVLYSQGRTTSGIARKDLSVMAQVSGRSGADNT